MGTLNFFQKGVLGLMYADDYKYLVDDGWSMYPDWTRLFRCYSLDDKLITNRKYIDALSLAQNNRRFIFVSLSNCP